jgi:hypothetical protein
MLKYGLATFLGIGAIAYGIDYAFNVEYITFNVNFYLLI